MIKKIEDIFVTEGVPEFTFVPPPNFNDIFVDIRRAKKPVVIEGQSGSGKTTCVKKIIEKLEIIQEPTYLSARDQEHQESIIELASNPKSGLFVIDDFHRLTQFTQDKLANIAKLAAEQANEESNLPKLILIGINEIGSDLISLVPDIAKRMGIHKISPGSREDIAKLIYTGCKELNVEIENSEEIYDESLGDYWLTQQLCQQICLLNGIMEGCTKKKTIQYELNDLRAKVVAKLNANFYNDIKDFCRGQRFRPSNDPYYKLLRAISKQAKSVVDLNDLSGSSPEARGSINNIKERRLADLLRNKATCAKLFYYNPETKNFAIEDAALFYFLKHLDWQLLRSDCGFRDSDKDFEYDFAISFAGENRELAKCIADNLEILDSTVFFDANYESNFLGKALSKVFEEIFSEEKSHIVICLLDKNHRDKIWPTFERQCFQNRVGSGEVIPIFLDDTNFVGISSEIWGIKFSWNSDNLNWKNEVIDKIVFKLEERLKQTT